MILVFSAGGRPREVAQQFLKGIKQGDSRTVTGPLSEKQRKATGFGQDLEPQPELTSTTTDFG